MNVVVLISGRGSNLKALLDHQQGYRITHVISNNFESQGIATAQQHGVSNTCINWQNRQQAEHILTQLLQELPADLIVLAGFMRILSAQFVASFESKIINIHPSLLPKYPGLNTHQKVIDNQDKHHGATVHLVNDKLDHGPMLAQTSMAVDPSKDANQLAEQLINKEHKLLTTVVGLIANQQLQWDKQQIIWQRKPLSQPLMID